MRAAAVRSAPRTPAVRADPSFIPSGPRRAGRGGARTRPTGGGRRSEPAPAWAPAFVGRQRLGARPHPRRRLPRPSTPPARRRRGARRGAAAGERVPGRILAPDRAVAARPADLNGDHRGGGRRELSCPTASSRSAAATCPQRRSRELDRRCRARVRVAVRRLCEMTETTRKSPHETTNE